MTLEDMNFWYTVFNRACLAGQKNTSSGGMVAAMVCILLRDAVDEEIHREEKRMTAEATIIPNPFPNPCPELSVKAFEALLQITTAFDRYVEYKGQPTPSWDELIKGIDNARLLFKRGQIK